MTKIQIAILGYGNLGKSVEKAITYHEDLSLYAIFSSRGPDAVKTNTPAYFEKDLIDYKDHIDVLILCGGSRSDIPVQGPKYAKYFNTIDVYDNHGNIDNYFHQMDKAARESGHTSIISTGWDPGLFSINRIISQAILPEGQTYTFWGKGLSQGHSDAVRRVEGIKDAVQYTIPASDMIEDIKDFKDVTYNQKDAHVRQVYVVPEDGADKDQITHDIVNMEDYFVGYETHVEFIDQETLDRDHSGMPHGGHVIRRGRTDKDHQAIYEFYLDLQSNPGFTGSAALAYARASYKLSQEEKFGARTVADIPPAYMSPLTPKQIRQTLI